MVGRQASPFRKVTFQGRSVKRWWFMARINWDVRSLYQPRSNVKTKSTADPAIFDAWMWPRWWGSAGHVRVSQFFFWQILEWQLSTWKPYRVLWRSTKNLWRCPGFYWWINFGDGSDLYSWLEVLSNRNNMWLNHTACVFLSNLWQVVEISWSLALKNPVILGPFFMLDYWESFACPDWENRRFVPQPTKWYIVKL